MPLWQVGYRAQKLSVHDSFSERELDQSDKGKPASG